MASSAAAIRAAGLAGPDLIDLQEALARLQQAPPATAPSLEGMKLPEDLPAHGCSAGAFKLADYMPSMRTYVDRASALALIAAQRTVDGILSSPEDRQTPCGLAYSTAWGCLDSMELFFGRLSRGNPRAAPALPFSHSFANSPASLIAIAFSLNGHNTTHSGGWTCGVHALGAALDALRLGRSDCMLAGGSEAISALLLRHHDARGELAPTGRLGAGTDAEGLVPGEGGAFLLLEPDAEGASALARISGFGAAGGPPGEPPVADAVRQALRDAQLEARDIDLVLSGATGLAELDEVECEAMDALVREDRLAASCLRPAAHFGYWSGAAPALAAALATGILSQELSAASLPAAQPFGAVPEDDRPVANVLVTSYDLAGAAAALVMQR